MIKLDHPYYTIEEAAERANVSEKDIRLCIETGRLRAFAHAKEILGERVDNWYQTKPVRCELSLDKAVLFFRLPGREFERYNENGATIQYTGDPTDIHVEAHDLDEFIAKYTDRNDAQKTNEKKPRTPERSFYRAIGVMALALAKENPTRFVYGGEVSCAKIKARLEEYGLADLSNIDKDIKEALQHPELAQLNQFPKKT